jgi:hypothetical protein
MPAAMRILPVVCAPILLEGAIPCDRGAGEAPSARPEPRTRGDRRAAVWEREKWMVFGDAPLQVPGLLRTNPGLPRNPNEVRVAKSKFASQSRTVTTDGARLEVSFDDLNIGGFPGKLQCTVYEFGGSSYQSLPVDLSEKRLCEERCFGTLDDMNNWGSPTYMISAPTLCC